MPLQEQSHIVIGHLTSRTPAWGLTWWGEERRYQPTAFPVRRPAEGETIVELHCGTCDAELLLRMRSLALSRSIRKRFLVTASSVWRDRRRADAGWAFGLGVRRAPFRSRPRSAKAWLSSRSWRASRPSPSASTAGARGGPAPLLRYRAGDETHRVLSGAEPHDASGPVTVQAANGIARCAWPV